MHQVTEFSVAEGVVAEILDDCASVGVGMGFSDLVFRQSREWHEQQGLVSGGRRMRCYPLNCAKLQIALAVNIAVAGRK